jgi:PHD/YefM family antitoxin component YafN of YafNO toxin-antitoxin module
VITRRGVETAVVVSAEDWARLSAPQGRLIDILRRAPRLRGGLDVTRSKDTGRDVGVC